MNHNLKLIETHKRNLAYLKRQQAMFDPGMAPLSTVNQIAYTEKAISEIEGELQRRLELLLLKAAQYGISADPAITMEIEDIQKYFEDNRSQRADYI